ncbi:class I SAM-dependent DNA methyltransferase [Pseudenhygromyxa sp. WMMC2535]|uniref:class I SAM-dependent DNA methyltransferase n=1 Tax=Pseudenhygromyxa sp. WMMC2535 TaxID=2712867 RepID=UPI0031FA3107
MEQSTTNNRNGSLGFEDKLWAAADLLRNNMDPAEYKHVVLGLIFLKYISDAFEERQQELIKLVSDPDSDEYIEDLDDREAELAELLEDRDEYTAENVFWVPHQARWHHLQGQATQPTIGKLVDDAMIAIEKDNPSLKGALPKIYGGVGLDKRNLGELINLIGGIGLGSKEDRDKDTLGRVYEYFLSRFASAEGKGGGEFYTPSSVVRVLVEMLEPYSGRVYDPCCGSGGMFVQSLRFIEAHDGKRDAVSVYGQESNPTTWRMARMNLAIRGIEANLGHKHADSFKEDLHPDLRADFVMANPPFNISKWGGKGLLEDVRWKYGVPPAGNANFAWVQHIVHHLSPTGTAGIVLANGSMSSTQSGEGDIRQRLVEADLIDCMVALPGQLFYATQIPVCLWFLARDKRNGKFRDRRGEVLFIDARKLGRMETRVHRVFSEQDVGVIVNAYHTWRKGEGYEDAAGFCKAATKEYICAHDFVLTPGRYVDPVNTEDNGEPFEKRMRSLTTRFFEQIGESGRLEAQIRAELRRLGYD